MNNPDYGKISLWIAALVVAVLTLPHAFATLHRLLCGHGLGVEYIGRVYGVYFVGA